MRRLLTTALGIEDIAKREVKRLLNSKVEEKPLGAFGRL